MKKRKIITSLVTAIVIATVLTVMLLCYFLFTIKDCSTYFNSQVLTKSLQMTADNTKSVRSNVNTSLDCVKDIATRASGVSGYDQIDGLGEQLVQKYGIACLQFYFEGEAHFRYGEGVGSSTSDELKAMIHSGQYSASNVFVDDALGTQCIAMYGPVSGNAEIDGVVAYFDIEKLFTVDFDYKDIMKFYCLAQQDGAMLETYSSNDFKTDVSHNVYTYITNLTHTKSPVPMLEENCKNGISASYELDIDNKDYILSCAPIRSATANYILFNIYEKNDVLQDKYPLYSQLFGVCIAVIIFSIITFLVFIINSYHHISNLAEIEEIDPLLGCNTYHKFASESTSLLATNRHSGYAMVYFDINKFTFIRENFGSETCDGILRQISVIISKILSDNETYGHIVDDRFAALMHCANMQDLTNRIKIISALISSYAAGVIQNFNLTLAIGVYEVDRSKNYNIQEMLDRASIAEKIHKQHNSEPFILYDSSIRASYLKEAEIESKMEYSLKNREFKVFYQPKYNLKNQCIDGAEALVRWYDPKNNSYTNPADFVPLFEVNGFISKLDRFVFKSVCEFLQEQTERGEKTVLISVNVSRVSATEADFLSFYINTKKQYNIPDGHLMLEFTESFACENYQMINDIIIELRKNGFKCSIDDFGSGYSSFETLKELTMDELKLDKMFLNPSSDRDRDLILLKSIIELGNSFNMKVTQEGVETIEQLRILEEYGCTVIQGYYYSKPIPTSDFIEFIGGNTSLDAIINNVLQKRNQEKSHV